MAGTGDILSKLRRKAGLSQTTLAARMGITQSAYSRLETGSRKPDVDLLRAAARELGVALGVLLGTGEEPARRFAADAVALPLLGRVPAGPPAEVDPIEETHPVLPHLAGRDRYVLRADGHSMSPEIKHGDLILVQWLDGARPEDLQGRVCICRLNGETTMKRVYVERRQGRSAVVLRGDNPESAPIRIGEPDDLLIQGRVVAVVGREL